MKLYYLRHEKRGSSCSFFSSLTPDGIRNAKELINKLPKLDEVWSSPYKRCIQTIYPYCNFYNLDIFIENGLSEYNHNIELKNNEYIEISNYKELLVEMDLLYDKSIITNKEIVENFPENNERIYNRIKKFLEHNLKNWKNKNVLICSHLHCYYMLRGYFENKIYFSNSPEMGEVRLLYEE